MPAPETPRLTTDIIIELADRPGRPIVLIERRFPPPGWAIPGGFVDVGESVEAAAVREAQEETSLHVTLLVLLGVYSDPKRDPRRHTASVVYVAEDDARSLMAVLPGEWPAPLAFDHATILADYLTYRATGRTAGPRPLR